MANDTANQCPIAPGQHDGFAIDVEIPPEAEPVYRVVSSFDSQKHIGAIDLAHEPIDVYLVGLSDGRWRTTGPPAAQRG